jgi:AcrR family transcriptional regulator
MDRTEKRPRRYRSSLRDAQADATRQRVLEAAGRCFASKGFTSTTLGAIAAEAGVSVETVQSHGPKRRLLLAAVETVSAGSDGGRSILDVPEAKAVLEQTDNREALAGLAAFAAELNDRIGRLWQALAAAAQGDPELAAAHAGLQERIRADFVKVVQALQSREGLRTDLKTEELAATLWVLTSPHQYELLVVQARWSKPRYRAWLERVIAEAVCGAEQRPARAG